MNFTNFILGLIGALIYSILGFAASGQPWSWNKFAKTFGLALLVVTGLDVTGLNADANAWVSLVSPVAVVAWLQKLIQAIAKPAS